MTLPMVARAAVLSILLLAMPRDAAAVRIKDVARVEGVRTNQLIGYGLVVGLDRTGDTQRSAFTVQSLTAMLSRLGIRIDPKQLLLRNSAAVMVTATLPALAQPGTPINVVVSSIGDARSLVGGMLLLTPLRGVDGKTYAMSQGSVQVSGYGASGSSGSRVQRGHLNAGRVPGGAIVERTVPIQLSEGGTLTLQLDRPDFSTARKMVASINGAAAGLGGAADMARLVDGGRIKIVVPEQFADSPAEFIAQIEVLSVEPDVVARVVINGRSGTIVLGEQVRIATVAISHGSLTIEVTETPTVSQPAPLSAGTTATTTTSQITVAEQRGTVRMVPAGAALADVVAALNALGATPRDLVDILQAIEAAGALHAHLEVI